MPVFVLSGFLIYHFRFSPGTDSFFTHFFYIPIILTAFWWQYRVIPVIFLIMISLISADNEFEELIEFIEKVWDWWMEVGKNRERSNS